MKGQVAKGAGTRHYMAPEMIKRMPYDLKVDVWSASIVVFIMLTGRMPYNGNNYEEIGQRHDTFNPFNLILKRNNNAANSGTHQPQVSELAIDFLRKGMHIDCSKRGSVQEMLQHQWLSGVQEPRAGGAVDWTGYE